MQVTSSETIQKLTNNLKVFELIVGLRRVSSLSQEPKSHPNKFQIWTVQDSQATESDQE